MPAGAINTIDDIFQKADTRPFSSLHFGHDPTTQLQAIVAIHSSLLGPALGGCRFMRYPTTNDAIVDVLNLARGMTYKAAFNKVPFGGGKAVVLMPPGNYDRRALMESYGDFIESLGGQFITAMDSGTCTEDMDIISERTQHVVCTSKDFSGSGDPSPHTARGVLKGIQAAVRYVFKREQLDGLHILIQGVGHVGYHLADYLHRLGASLSISDFNKEKVIQCQDEFSARVVEPDKVYQTQCDIFSPCALGQVVNQNTIENLNMKVIAGAANNQLIDAEFGQRLRNKGITYAPDYVINSGGLLQIAYVQDENELKRSIDNIYDALLTIFEKSDEQNIATNLVANQMARKYMDEFI